MLSDFEETLLKRVSDYSPDMIYHLSELVNIPSVKGFPQEGFPFGYNVAQALNYVLCLGETMGFQSTNLDNYIGYTHFGQSDSYLGILGHLDVVPPGEGWDTPPFECSIRGEYIYGRGVLDNKGPMMACLFGMYALKELGYRPKTEIRIIYGCDEESGFNDIPYYLAHEEAPLMGFTPDCKYPVVYGERGRAKIRVEVSSHEAFDQLMNRYILNTNHRGRELGIHWYHEEFGQLELRNYESDATNLGLDFEISYPSGITCNELLNKLRNTLPGTKVKLVKNYDPVFFDKESNLVTTLGEVYEELTGLDGTPVTTTGGTYAKIMPNIVPFGPSFPGQRGIAHNPNEWMKLTDLILNAQIYALGIYRLSQLMEVYNDL